MEREAVTHRVASARSSGSVWGVRYSPLWSYRTHRLEAQENQDGMGWESLVFSDVSVSNQGLLCSQWK